MVINRNIIQFCLPRSFFFFLCLSCMAAVAAQERKYTVSNAHAHNDYEHTIPFFSAYTAGFGSIEADIFLKNGQLFVSHDTTGIRSNRTLETLYLRPLKAMIRKNNGHVYSEKGKTL